MTVIVPIKSSRSDVVDALRCNSIPMSGCSSYFGAGIDRRDGSCRLEDDGLRRLVVLLSWTGVFVSSATVEGSCVKTDDDG